MQSFDSASVTEDSGMSRDASKSGLSAHMEFIEKECEMRLSQILRSIGLRSLIQGVPIAVVLGAGACGSSHPPSSPSPTSPPSGSDSGTGSKTLYVGVELTLSSLGADATPAPSLSVVLAQSARGASPVSNATVKLTATDGTSVTASESSSVPGSYQASNFTWEPSWHLEIAAGSDHLEAGVVAPGRTRITAPAPNATVPAGQVEFQWTDDWGNKAQSTWVSPCCGQSVVDLTDSGSGSAPAVAPGGVYFIYRQDVTPLAVGVSASFASATSSNGTYLNVQ